MSLLYLKPVSFAALTIISSITFDNLLGDFLGFLLKSLSVPSLALITVFLWIFNSLAVFETLPLFFSNFSITTNLADKGEFFFNSW